MKKTLFLISSLNVGGIENYLLRFLSYYKSKFIPIVICKHGYSGILENKYKDQGVEIIPLRLGYFSLFNFFRFYRFLKTNSFVSICDFTGDFGGIPLFIAKCSGIKNRIVFYRGSRYQFKTNFLKWIYIKTIKFLLKSSATRILSNSEAAFNYFHSGWKNEKTKFRVIYNGIPEIKIRNFDKKEIKSYFNIPNNSFVVGHIGSFREAKNQKVIIEVADILRKKYNDIYFLLCGVGLKEGFGREIFKRNLDRYVITPGNQDNIWEVLQIFDIFFLPSLNEGQPNALLEAMIAGIPVIASNINSIKESVNNEVLRNLKPPDDVGGFISLIEDIKKNGVRYNLEKVKIWSMDRYDANKRFLEFYQELINK